MACSGSAKFMVNFTVATAAGVNWLQAQAMGGVTPRNVTITANPQNLPAGTYTGTVTISSPGAGNSSVTVPATLTVTGGPSIQLSTTSLAFAYQTGQAQPASQAVTITATGGAQIGFTAAASTSPSWLTIFPTSGTTNTGIAQSSITATVNAAGLAPGTYTGSIIVTPAGGDPPTRTLTLPLPGAPPRP